jgi:hypothetical protein
MLEPAEAIAAAVEQAGCSDFGPAGWRDGLERSLAAFATLPLTDDARAAAKAKIVSDLATRLRIEQWWKDHPEMAETPVEGPVLVCGLPRTGTTATVAMMALDPRFRFLRGWEANQPVPPPVAEEEASDPRVLAAHAAADAYADQALHLFDPDGPEEDLAMLAGLDMHAYHGAYPMPREYLDWWIAEDFRGFYAWHRRVLTLLHSRRPPRLWLLKAPPHLFKLAAFAAEYPDAKFVMTHRDPARLIPSVCSLHYHLHAERCREGSLDKASYGPRHLTFWAEGMRRGLEARRAIGEHRFIDLRNDDLAARPVETFEELYERLGFELSDGLRAAVLAYNRRNARGAHGEHRYTAEEFGLTREGIREAFGDYAERFGV